MILWGGEWGGKSSSARDSTVLKVYKGKKIVCGYICLYISCWFDNSCGDVIGMDILLHFIYVWHDPGCGNMCMMEGLSQTV